MAGQAKENLPGGCLKYLFVYLKVRIFKCSYRSYWKWPIGIVDLPIKDSDFPVRYVGLPEGMR